MLAHVRPRFSSIWLILLARGWQRLTLATAHIRARVVCPRRRSPHLPSLLYHCWTDSRPLRDQNCLV